MLPDPISGGPNKVTTMEEDSKRTSDSIDLGDSDSKKKKLAWAELETGEKKSEMDNKSMLTDEEKTARAKRISEVVNQRLASEELEETNLIEASKNMVEDPNIYADELEMVEESKVKSVARSIGDKAKKEMERLWSGAIIQTCDNIINAFAWANAGLLDNAFQIIFIYIARTNHIKLKISVCNWIYFVFMILFCWIFITKFPYGSLSDNEDWSEDQKKRSRGCCTRCFGEKIMERKLCSCCRFVHDYTSEIKRAFFFLAIDTLAIVVSFAAREATMTSFAWLFNRTYENGEFHTSDEDDDAVTEASGLVAVTLGYAIMATTFIIFCMLKLGPSKKKEKKEAEKAKRKALNPEESSASSDIDLAHVPMLRFWQFTAGIVIAWAWRGYFQVFILLILDENHDNALVGYWIYAFLIAFFVVLILSIFDLYQCVPIYEDLPFQTQSSEREYIFEVLKAAIVFVVALSFIEAFTESFDEFSDGETEVTAQWIYCGLVSVIMIVSNLYLEHLVFGIGTIASGIATEVTDSVNSLRGSKAAEKIIRRETFWNYFLHRSVYVLNTSVSVAAAFSVRDAVKSLLQELSTESSTKSDDNDINWGRLIRGAWFATLGAMFISATATIYLAKVIKRAQTRSKAQGLQDYEVHSFYEVKRSASKYMGNWD